ncbi:MAG TPA: hypothetical protein VKM93_09460 [Terriglobia bacterium]|nr:hypothetical protein [Terriglobia bacterium]
MAQRIVPSSFECDCGHQSHFCEGTVWEMEANSRRRHKPMLLLDSEAEEHAIEFEEGEATTVICPKLGRRKITGCRLLQPTAKKRAKPKRRVARRPAR